MDLNTPIVDSHYFMVRDLLLCFELIVEGAPIVDSHYFMVRDLLLCVELIVEGTYLLQRKCVCALYLDAFDELLKFVMY